MPRLSAFHRLLISRYLWISCLLFGLWPVLWGQATLEKVEAAPISETLFRTGFRYAYQLTVDTIFQDSSLQFRLEAFKTLDTSAVRQRWSINGAPVTADKDTVLKGALRYAIEVEGLAPGEGIYTGAIRWQAGQKKEFRVFRFRRTTDKPSLEFAGPAASRSRRIYFSLLDTTSGGDVTVYPTLLALNEVTDEDQQIQARFRGFAFYDEAGNALAGPLVISSRQSRPLQLRIKGLHKAGKYQGTVRVTGEEITKVNREFTLLIRHGWWRAALAIFVGVLISFWIRDYFQKRRPRAVREIQVREQIEQLDQLSGRLGVLSPEEQDAVESLKQDFQAQLRRVADDKAQFDALLTKLNDRLAILPVWINVSRKVGGLERGAKTDLERQLAGIEAFLKGISPKKEEDDFGKQLAQISQEADELIKAAFKRKLDAFAEEVEAALAEAPAEETLKSIRERLAGAGKHAEAGEMGRATGLFNESRNLYVDHTIRMLKEKMKEDAPVGVQKDQWAAVQAEIIEILNAPAAGIEAKFEAYRQASARYRKVVMQGMYEHMSILSRSLEASGSMEADEKTALRQELDELMKGVESEMSSTADPAEAGSLKSWGEKVGKIEKKLRDGGAYMGTAGKIAGLLANLRALPGRQDMPPDLVPEVNQVVLKRLQTWIDKQDLRFSLILLLAAVVLGIQLLWLNDSTWGAVKDYIIAFLWGLGLHQVGDMANSIGALEQRLKGESVDKDPQE